MFQKTKYYPVNPETKEIINLPFLMERNVFIMFKGTGFIGLKGKRLNDHKCYTEFTVKPSDFKITGETITKHIHWTGKSPGQ